MSKIPVKSKTKSKTTSESKTKPEKAEKPVAEPSKAKAGKPSGLEALVPPKKLGNGCMGFELKDVRNTVATLCGALSIAATDFEESETPVLLESVDDTGCRVTYYRHGSTATATIPAHVFAPGSFVVTTELFRAIKGTSPFAVFTVFDSSNRVDYRCGNSSGSVQCLNTPDAYRSLIAMEKPKTPHVLDRNTITEIASRLMFSSFDPGIPAMGLPLNIVSSRKNKTTVFMTNDNLVGGIHERNSGITSSDIDITLPGMALIKAVKATTGDEIKFGYTEDQKLFRVRANGVDITHPCGTYDIIDLKAWLAEEASETPDYEIMVSSSSFMEALQSCLSMSMLDKTESKVTIEFAQKNDSQGFVKFLGTGSKASTEFEISRIKKRGESMILITEGKRIAAFVAILKDFDKINMRVRAGRCFMSSPGKEFTFMVPLQ